jgi:hypothetical protein
LSPRVLIPGLRVRRYGRDFRLPLSPRSALAALLLLTFLGFCLVSAPAKLLPNRAENSFSLLEPPACPNLYESGTDEAEEAPVGVPAEEGHTLLVGLPTERPIDDFLNFGRHLGDSPMQQTWKQIVCYTSLSIALSAGPELVRAGAGEPQAVAAEAQRFEDLDKQIKELKRAMTAATQSLDKMDKDLKDFRTESQLGMSNAETKIQNLSSDLANLKLEVENLRSRIANNVRVSGFGPVETPAGTGRVELVNVYPQEVSVAVNNRVYRLLPNEIRLTDPIPAGTFTYEVLGVTDKRSRLLATDKVYPIYIHQQP